MYEQAAILISRKRNEQKEVLFIRPKDKNFLEFPHTKNIDPRSMKSELRKYLKDSLDLVVPSIYKVDVVVFQLLGESTTILNLYTTEIADTPHPNAQIEEISWLTKDEAAKRIAQISNVMQDYILPSMEEEGLWD